MSKQMEQEEELKLPYATWDKIGKKYSGIYVKKEIVPVMADQAANKGTNKQTIYYLAEATVQQDNGPVEPIEGGVLKVYGRGYMMKFPPMDIAEFGQKISFKFVEQRAPAKKGVSGAKIIRISRVKGVMKMDVVEKFKQSSEEELDTSDIEAESIVEKM